MNDVKFLIRSALYYIFACKSHRALFRTLALKLDGPTLRCSLHAVRFGVRRNLCVQCDGTRSKWQSALFFIALVHHPAGGVMVDV